MKGYWKIFLKNKKPIENENYFNIDFTSSSYGVIFVKNKSNTIILAINKDEFIKAEWVEL